jgi:hypothetical protein
MSRFKHLHIHLHNAACQENIKAGWEIQGKAVAADGNVKANYKPVAFVKFYSTIKSQISSTKLQINIKSQYSTGGASAGAARDPNIR